MKSSPSQSFSSSSLGSLPSFGGLEEEEEEEEEERGGWVVEVVEIRIGWS